MVQVGCRGLLIRTKSDLAPVLDKEWIGMDAQYIHCGSRRTTETSILTFFP
jgi:hypothetical protein